MSAAVRGVLAALCCTLLPATATAADPRPVRFAADPAPKVLAAPLVDDVTAVVTVVGRAMPRSTVVLSGRCARGLCLERAIADRRGRWTARIDLVLRRATRSVELVAAYAPPAMPGPPDRLRIAVPRVLPAMPRTAPHVVLIGDSLGEGIVPNLASALPDVRLTAQTRRSRSLGEGMRILDLMALPPDRFVAAFSLFTNDHAANIADLERAVQASVVRVGPRGCAVWATIARPAHGKASYAPVNARLEALAADPALSGRLQIVPWAREARRRGWLAKDRVHATPAGYAGRAELYAAAVRRCLSG
jgi:hypothetical protein